MKVLHVSIGDFSGGAARAAYRVHHSQVVAGIDSQMLVLYKETNDDRVVEAPKPLLRSLYQRLGQYRLNYRQRGWSADQFVYCNFGNNSAGLVNEINESGADIVNLHWVCNMLSIKDIARLRKPIVWTLHDMWAFCGGEHYVQDGDAARFRCGYLPGNRPEGETGADLNRKTWENKCRYWINQNFTIVCPSCWLADCAKKSVLLANKSIHVIPNPLDLDTVWKPLDCSAVRVVLGLPKDKKLILFGAVGGTADLRKGADLLSLAVRQVAEKMPGRVELMIYGQEEKRMKGVWPCPVHWLGEVRDDRVLAQIYCAADVMIVPSRQDNLPNTAVEAQACGTPVVAFDVGGLPDIVSHRKTGWLAKPYDTSSLAEGVLWLLGDEVRLSELSVAARKRAVEHYTEHVVGRSYGELYEELKNQAFAAQSYVSSDESVGRW